MRIARTLRLNEKNEIRCKRFNGLISTELIGVCRLAFIVDPTNTAAAVLENHSMALIKFWLSEAKKARKFPNKLVLFVSLLLECHSIFYNCSNFWSNIYSSRIHSTAQHSPDKHNKIDAQQLSRSTQRWNNCNLTRTCQQQSHARQTRTPNQTITEHANATPFQMGFHFKSFTKFSGTLLLANSRSTITYCVFGCFFLLLFALAKTHWHKHTQWLSRSNPIENMAFGFCSLVEWKHLNSGTFERI